MNAAVGVMVFNLPAETQDLELIAYDSSRFEIFSPSVSQSQRCSDSNAGAGPQRGARRRGTLAAN